MRLFIVLDHGIYHPKFLADFLQRTPDQVVGAVVVTKIPRKNDIERYLLEHFYYLRIREIFKLFIRKMAITYKGFFNCQSSGSITVILNKYNIDYIEVEKSINQEQYLNEIAARNPDVIISSNPLIFGEKILKLPNICCINRHSALLPSYGGLLPMVHAFRNGEKYTGVSIHVMEKNIDTGAILAQLKVPISSGETVDILYKKCFDASVDALLIALDKIRNRDFTPVQNDFPPSYFSWPQAEHWREFRKKGGRII